MSEIGALSLRIQETGGQAVVDRLHEIDESGGDASDALGKVSVAMKGVTASAKGIETARTEVAKWSGTQAELSREIAEGTRLFQLQARTVDVTSKDAVRELRSSAAAQREWLKQIGASTEAQLKFGAAVQTFEKKVTAAENAQARQAGQTAKQSQATQALHGHLVRADGQITAFGKSGLRALNGLAFAFSQMADQGEASLRSIAGQMTSVLSLLGKGGAIASIASTVGLAVFDIVRAGQKRAIDKMALDSQTATRAELTRQKAAIDLTEAQQSAAYTQGLATLRDFYTQRGQIIAARTSAEIKSREDQIAAFEREAEQRLEFVRIGGKDLPDALRGDTLKQADQLRAQATQLRAEITALQAQGQAETIRNTAERAAAEKQLAEQALGYETRRLEAQGQGHRARLAQIQMEVAAYDKLLAQQGLNEDHRALATKQYEAALTRQVQMERELQQLGIAQQNLDVARARIQADVALGKVNELQAAEQIAQAEREALPAMQALVTKALELAAALGDQGAVAAIQRLKQEMEGLGRNTSLDGFIRMSVSPTAGASVKAAVDKILKDVAAGAIVDVKFNLDAQNLMQAAQSVDQQFANLLPAIAGVLGDTLGAAFSDGLGAAGDVLLKGLGNIMMQMGQALVVFGLSMMKLLPALLNPFTSGPAALAAGAALIALGGLLGGIAGGKGSSSSSGGAARAAAPSTDLSKFFVTDPRVTNRQGLTANAAAAATPTVVQFGLVNPADPATQRLISDTVTRAQRRGA